MGFATVLRLATAFLVLTLGGAAWAQEQAERPRGVVELFTSQGCSSCPPADALLAELAQSGDVVALAYHIDYWDYLGWKDTLATPDNTQRQYDYNRAFGNRMVYTPQAVINGRVHVNGAKRVEVEGAIGRMAGTTKGLSVDVTITYGDESLIIETGEAQRPGRKAQIVLVYFEPVTSVEIERGKNKGRTVRYWNAVSGFHTVGMWHGEAGRVELPRSVVARKAGGGCAVLLQEVREDGLPGVILGASIVSKPYSG